MKTTLILLIASIQLIAQPTVNVWRVSPDTICSGDTLKIYYKGGAPNPSGWPTFPDASTNYFSLQPSGVILWSGNWSILKAMPKEHFSGIDSCHVIKIPVTASVGQYSIATNGSSSIVNRFNIKACEIPCTITSSFTYTNSGAAYFFTSTSVGANTYTFSLPNPVTFTANGTYTVGLTTQSGTCFATSVQAIVVSGINMVGIIEHELTPVAPVYYDIYGNRSDKIKGVLLIEVVGGKRRKVIFE